MSNLAHALQEEPSRDLSPLEKGLSKQYNHAANKLSAAFEKNQVAQSAVKSLEKEMLKLDQAYDILRAYRDDHITKTYQGKRERIIQDLAYAQQAYFKTVQQLKQARQEVRSFYKAPSSPPPNQERQTEDPYMKLKERMLEQTDKVFEREIAEKALLKHDEILAEKKWNIVEQLKRTYKAIKFAYESLLFAEG